MLSVLFWIELKTIYAKIFFVVFYYFWVNWKQSIPKGSKSEHNTNLWTNLCYRFFLNLWLDPKHLDVPEWLVETQRCMSNTWDIIFQIFFPKNKTNHSLDTVSLHVFPFIGPTWGELTCIIDASQIDSWVTFAAWMSLKDLTNCWELFLVLKHLFISCLRAPGSCNLQAARTWLRYDQRESSFPPGLKSLLVIWHPAAGWALCCRCCASGIVKHSYDLSFGRCFSIQEVKRRGSVRRWGSRRESTN